ncbi:hypothetical protein [Catellatospora sichuanensis]|uniref:hypothetical protein n=1 Tax=Catellatospora sichuanensis TaxID=1969805 RepID=UPI00118244A1|nr:hypothetical protein [Catellatospora sichuanensis]
MTLPIDPSAHPVPGPVVRPAMGWWRRHRVLRNWLSGVASAVVVSVISGVALAVLTPGEDTPGGGAAPASAAADEPPFSVDVLFRGDYCAPYAVNAYPGELSSPHRVVDPDSRIRPADDEVAEWMQRVDAIPAEGRLLLTLQGSTEKTVVLQDMTVEVVEPRGPAIEATTLFYPESGCGAGESPRLFKVGLDTANPRPVPAAGVDAAGNEIPAVAFPFSVSESDPEIFAITADPGHCDCTWRLRLRWTSAGRSGTLVIDDHGRPFRTAAVVDTNARKFVAHSVRGCPGGLAWCEEGA